MEADLHMMQRSEKWPVWPFLPLVNRHTKFGQEGHIGFLVEVDLMGKIEPKVYIGNFLTDKTLKDIPTKIYETFEDLVRDWKVD